MKKYKTQWDLTLLYKSSKDPQIEKDMISIEKLCVKLEKKYKNCQFIETPGKLFRALEDVERLTSSITEAKPLIYAWLRLETNNSDNQARATLRLFEEGLTVAGNKLVFFDLAIAKIPKKQQKDFLAYKPLQKYRYLLERAFLSAKYLLTEKEEQLIGSISQPAFSMWVDANQKLQTQQKVLFKKEYIPLSKAEAMINDLNKKDRAALYKEITSAYKICVPIGESEINAIGTYKKILDERRGYKTPYTEQMISHELDEQTVNTLTGLTTKYFKISQKFYRLHKKLLKQDKLSYEDRQAKIGSINKKLDFDSGIRLIEKAFNQVDGKYSLILRSFLERGQIDVFPRNDKQGGGYCISTDGAPTFILLNHTEDLRSVETLAHELGHAFHWLHSKSQPYHYRRYTMATAEVASTFFEQVFSGSIINTLSDKEKVIYLHSKLLSDITTVFRQVACFNFEKELHTEIRAKGALSSPDIQNLLVKHLQKYLGKEFVLTEDDGLQYIAWSHLRLMFYTISYAYGFLVSKALYERWIKDPSYIKKIEKFLSAGGSMSPKDIFKSVGIDTSNPKFFESGLKAIDADITKLEKLAKKLKMI